MMSRVRRKGAGDARVETHFSASETGPMGIYSGDQWSVGQLRPFRRGVGEEEQADPGGLIPSQDRY